jgi:hypothetical protein
MSHHVQLRNILKDLSADDFKMFGMDRLAYVTEADHPEKVEDKVYEVRAADGSIMVTFDDPTQAQEVLKEYDLSAMPIH